MKFLALFVGLIHFSMVPSSYAQDRPSKAEENLYSHYVKQAEDSAAKAYNLWEHAKMGRWEGYNLDSMYSAYNILRQNSLLKNIEFIKQHPERYVSLYYFQRKLLNSTRIDVDSLLTIFSFLSKSLRDNDFGKEVYERLKVKRSLGISNAAPEFFFITTEGDSLRLEQFRNKSYVLLCFWTSWCGPCKRNIPFLKEVNDKYKEKGLQLISISVDKDDKAWLKAVKQYQMPWPQTCYLPNYVPDQKVDILYDIHFIPQYFLLNKEGKIIYHDVLLKDDDSHSILQSMLKELMN